MSNDELQRLVAGPAPGRLPEGIGTESIWVKCSDGAEKVISQVKERLSIALSRDFADKKGSFPSWFIDSFHEGSQTALRFRADPVGNEGDIWTLAGWIFWLDEDERLWRWWDYEITSDDEFIVRIVALDWLAPSGALKWLLYAAGASEIRYLD